MLAFALLGGCFEATDPYAVRPPVRSYLVSWPRPGDWYRVGDTVQLTGYFRCGTGCVLHFADSTLPLIHQDSVRLVFQVPPMSAPDSFWIELADTNLPGGMVVMRYWNYSGDGTYYSGKGWPAGYELPSGCLALKDTIFCKSCFNKCSGVYAYSPGRSTQWELYFKTDGFKDFFNWGIDTAGGRLYIRAQEWWYDRVDTGWRAMSTFAGAYATSSAEMTGIYQGDGKLKLLENVFWRGHFLWDYDPVSRTWLLQDSIPYATPDRETYSRLYNCGGTPILANTWVQGDTVADSTGPKWVLRSLGRDFYRMSQPKRFLGRVTSRKAEIGPWDHGAFCFEGGFHVVTLEKLLKLEGDALVEQLDYQALVGAYSPDSLYGALPIHGLVRYGERVIGLGKWMFHRKDGGPWQVVGISTRKLPYSVITSGLGYEDLLGDREPLWVDGLGNLWSNRLQVLPLGRLRF